MTIDIPSLIHHAGGKVVGKVRLQKIVYLLDQMGMRSGFAFEYHHYGPYSDALSEQVEDDVIFGNLEARPGRRQSDGVPYVVYLSDTSSGGEDIDQHLSLDRIHAAASEMQKNSATVLELAATIHWLSEIEGVEDWRRELGVRKGSKTQGGRVEQALELLRTLGLRPAATSP